MKRVLVIGSVVLILGTGAALVWTLRPIRTAFYTDAESIRAPLATTTPRDILWQPPVALPAIINSSADDYEPRMSADGLTLYFVRGKAGRNADIHTSSRTAQGWTEPTPLIEVNSESDDLGPEPSADGESLYFYSNREGGAGGYDVWVARRGEEGWQPPANLGPAINTEYNDYGPAVGHDGKSLYFASNRPAADDARQPDPNAWNATLREDLFHRTYDLYAAAHTDAGWQRAVPLAALNTPYNEGAPAVSPFGDFLYFASDRADGEGGFDLYRTRRLRGEYQPPVNLGLAVNTSANELDPGLSLGGYRLDFSSDRRAADTDAPSIREYNIYQTTSREVFPETEQTARASIDWWGLWSVIAPNLLWALLALLLLLAMMWLAGGVGQRRMTLMMKCLLASLAAHMLLMLLFNTMKVASSIAEELGKGRRGPIQIALLPSTGGQALAQQFFIATEAPTPPSIESPSALRREMTPTLPTTISALNEPVAPSKFVASELSPPTASARDASPPAQIALTALTTVENPSVRAAVEAPNLESADPIAQAEAVVVPPTAATKGLGPAPLTTLASVTAGVEALPLAPSRIETSAPGVSVRSIDAEVQPAAAMSAALHAPEPVEAKITFPRLDEASPVRSEENVAAAPTRELSSGVRAWAVPALHVAPSATLPMPAVTDLGSTERRSLADSVSFHDTYAGRGSIPPTPLVHAKNAPIDVPRFAGASPAAPNDLPSKKSEPNIEAPILPPDTPTNSVRAAAVDSAEDYIVVSSALELPHGVKSPATVDSSIAASRGVADATVTHDTGAIQAPKAPFVPPTGHVAVALGLPVAEAPTALEERKGAESSQNALTSPPPPRTMTHVSQGTTIEPPKPISLPIDRRVEGYASAATLARFDDRREVDLPSGGTMLAVNLRPEPDHVSHSFELSLPVELPSTPPIEPHTSAEEEGSEPLEPHEVLGTIRGKVTDADTGHPIPRAKVRLDLPDQSSIVAITGGDGSYALETPDVPEFFALSASIEGYVPKSLNVERAKLEGRTTVRNFALEPASSAILVTEPVPDVHHLGDNRFDGTINSQFQKRSEGSEFTIQFDLTEEQLPPFNNRAQVRLMAKGVQRNHRIVINDNTLSRRLNKAPEDGGFGEFRASFDPTILRPGRNTLQIIASPSPDDIDDFEFVNVQVRLAP